MPDVRRRDGRAPQWAAARGEGRAVIVAPASRPRPTARRAAKGAVSLTLARYDAACRADELRRRSEDHLEHYDPRVGVVTIAKLEVLEKFWRRAKDPVRLQQAVEDKLTEQRRFVLAWDQQDKVEGARGVGKKVALQTRKATLADLGLNSITVHRWRTRLKPEEKFTRALEVAQAKTLRICEFSKGQTDQRGASGTNENEWFTPAEYIAAAREVLGEIDLDPASHKLAQQTVQARRYYTREDDGLTKPWPGRVWLNPPYMQPFIADFVAKLVEEVRTGTTTAAILLTHNYTDTAWFHHAAGTCSAICFTRGRIAFVNPDGDEAAPTQGQAFFYFGPELERFALRFGEIGFVLPGPMICCPRCGWPHPTFGVAPRVDDA